MGKSVARITRPPAVPRLRDGERLDIAEFLRRYEADARVLKAELIRGVVHVLRSRAVRNGKEIIVSPIDAAGHGAPHANLITWLGNYAAHTPHVLAYAPVTNVQPERDNAVEPDVMLRIQHEAGGQTTIGDDGYIHGPPELFVEVANTSARRDATAPRDECEAAGVKEYLVWQTQAGAIEWFALKRKKYAALAAADGIVRSVTFPGLWLDAPALLSGDMAKVLTVLQQGIASPEHAAFVAKLKKAAGKKKA